MKRRDIYWVAAYGLLAAATVLLCVTGGFAWFNAMYPYLAGFIQFSVYATAGELLSVIHKLLTKRGKMLQF